MKSYILTRKARNDVLDIGWYTDSTWGKAQRDLYLGRLYTAFSNLAASPYLGSDAHFILKGCRRYLEGKHVIFYKISSSKSIKILRVLHENMHHAYHLANTDDAE